MKSGNPKKYKVSPYLFSLSMTGLIGFLLCIGLIIYFQFASWAGQDLEAFLRERYLSYLFIVGICAAYLIGCILDGYCFWGTFEFIGTGIILRAPFRKKIRLLYDDVKQIGIDYGVVNGSRQFWIYVSTVEIDNKYWGKMIKLPFSKTTVRVQYSPSVLAAFLADLPQQLKKELQKGESILRF